MEEKKKNELGNIYGSRISKNGRWLNLFIVTIVKGEEVRITCPVRIEEISEKPHAQIGTAKPRKATIYGIPVYDDVALPKEQKAADEDNDLPF